jgi:hypothetical protein
LEEITLNHATRSVIVLLALALALGAEATTRAGSLTPGDLLVSTQSIFSGNGSLGESVLEYTTGGSLVQQFAVPYPGGRPITEDVRGIVANSAGQVQIFNGTFSPYLTTLTPTPGGGPGVGTYANTTFSGWSLFNNISYGEIGTIGNYVFAPSEAAGTSGVAGIVRFDMTTNSAKEFVVGTDYTAVTVGANGLVYAINNAAGSPTSEIDVFNPNTMQQVQTIKLSLQAFSADLRALAVDAAGQIFAAGWDGNIYQLDSTGAVVKSLSSGFSNLGSIAVDPSGDLVIGDRFGMSS